MVAKQLALVLFMKGDAMLLNQRDEVLWGVSREGRTAEVRVLADEMLVGCRRVKVAVGEIAAPATLSL